MSRRSRLVAKLLATTVLITTVFGSPSMAQPAFVTNRITSIDEDVSGTGITLFTQQDAPLPAPQISYLPGPQGQTIMVADFPGLYLKVPTHVVHPQSTSDEPSPTQPIDEIRIGQFQVSPPICRISVSARNPRVFKSISFKSNAGALVIKWSNDSDLLAVAPPRGGSRGNALPEPAPTRRPQETSWHRADAYVAQKPAALPPAAPDVVNPSKPTRTGRAVDAQGMPMPAPSVGMTMHKTMNGNHKGKEQSSPETAAAGDGGGKKGLLTKLFGKDKAQDGKVLTLDDHQADKKLTLEPESKTRPSQATATMKSVPTSGAASTSLDTKTAMSKDGTPDSDLELQPPVSNTLSEAADISVTKGDALLGQAQDTLKVDVTGPRRLSFKSFRLHDPERIVFDFSNFPELMNVEPPKVNSPVLLGMRLGTLTDKPDVSRLVLDLPDADVTVKTQTTDEQTTLALVISKAASWSLPPIGKIRAPGSKLIVLDAGHGGSDPGAQRGNVQEKEITMDIVNKLKKSLESRGATIVMTRSDDTFVSLEDRVKLTNSTNPDLFLSVHINALESTSDIHGIETYYQTEQSRMLADSIHQSLVSGLQAPDRSVRKARFYVINHTPVPAVLAEVGFISNKDEREKLISSDYQDKVADSLAQGVMLYLANRKTDSPNNVANFDPSKNAKPASASLAQSGLTPAQSTK
jgi:N-acetylmuramoyl-L-alanine amidase CwlD